MPPIGDTTRNAGMTDAFTACKLQSTRKNCDLRQQGQRFLDQVSEAR